MTSDTPVAIPTTKQLEHYIFCADQELSRRARKEPWVEWCRQILRGSLAESQDRTADKP